jgi:hypothetical protein
MTPLKELWSRIADFFIKNDFVSLMEMLRKLEWNVVLRSFYFWAVAVPLLIYIIMTKKIRLMVLGVSIGLFIVLLQKVLPTPGASMPLHDLLVFIGGTFGLVVVNLYFLFMRD